MRIAPILIGLTLIIQNGAGATHRVPGDTTAVLFQPYEFAFGHTGDKFVEACLDQGYRVIYVRDQIANTTPAVTPEEFRNYLKGGHGEWFIDSHGWYGFTIAAYESTTAGDSQRNIDYDYWVANGFDGCIYKTASHEGVGIGYEPICVGIDYKDVDGEVFNGACNGGSYEHVAWLNSSVNEGYVDTAFTTSPDADLFWKRKNGEYGKSWRLSGKARQGMELKYYGDSTMVLSPTVVEIYPPTGSNVEGVDGWVEFDCEMDTDVRASRVIRGYGSTAGGWITTGNAEWASDTRIEYRVSPVRIGPGCGVIVDSGRVHTPTGQYLDGNQNPFWSDGRGPNRDQYKVTYNATDIDKILAAGFEGNGAFIGDDGLPHVWCVTDPERGSIDLSLYGDGALLQMLTAAGGPERPHFYETTTHGGYESYWFVERDGDPLTGDCRTRPFPVTGTPETINDLRQLNTLVADWHETNRVPGEWNGSQPMKSGTVYDFYFVSTDPGFFWWSQYVGIWWNDHGFTSTTVELSSNDPDELHALAQTVYQDALDQGHPRLPMFVIIGEANEGLEPEKNIVGMYAPADVDSGCWWNCASDALIFDVDGDTLADLPWTRVVGYTIEEILGGVAATIDWFDGTNVNVSNRTLFTVGDRTSGCTIMEEPKATLLDIQQVFEAQGVPTAMLIDSDYSCYDDAGRLNDWCANVDAGVGGIFVSGQVSNRSNWCYFPTWTEDPPFDLDLLNLKQRFVLHGPGCGIGDTFRNNPSWYPSILKTFLSAEPSSNPSIVAATAHLVGGWSVMHTEWARKYTEHLFTDVHCYQRQVFNAYREMGEEEPAMKPYLLGVGVYGFPIPPPGFSFVGVAGSAPPTVRLTTLSNKPNPFNPSTTLHYELPGLRKVTLAIFDISGRKVITIVDGMVQEAGRYDLQWDGRNTDGQSVASGVYFARLETGAETRKRKIVLLR